MKSERHLVILINGLNIIIVKDEDRDKDLKGRSCYSPKTYVYLPKEIYQCLQRHKVVFLREGKWVAKYNRGDK